MQKSQQKNIESFKISSGLRRLFTGIAFFLFGFIISLASFPMSVHPLGPALASCIPRKNRKLPFYTSFSFYLLFIGITAAALTYKTDGILYFTMYCALFLIRMALSGGSFNETRAVKMALSVVSALFIGLAGGAINGFNIWQIFGVLILSVCAPIFTYLFDCVSDSEKSPVLYEAGCGAFIFAVLYGIKTFTLFSFSLPLIISGFITYAAAKKKGPLYGALMGVICGIAGENYLLPPVLGILGFTSGIFFEYSEAFSLLMGYVASIAYGIYCAGFDVIGILAPELLAACAAFFPIKQFIKPAHSQLTIPSTEKENSSVTESDDKLIGISDAFSALSEISMRAEKPREPDMSECDYFVKRAFEDTCSECVMKHACEIHTEKASRNLRKALSRALYDRRLASGEIPEAFIGKCCNTDKITAVSLRNYRRALTRRPSSRSRALSGEYNTVAKLLKSTACSENSRTTPTLPEAFRIKRALENLKITYRKIEVSGTRKAIIKVMGISAGTIEASSERIRSEIEKECGFAVELPEFYTENCEEVMQVVRRPKISLEYAKASITKNGEQKNGDRISIFENDSDCFYSLICDGMGSGQDAAEASEIASAFMEKLVCSKLPRDITIEILNNYLISKETECFSTVDLLEVDKVEAEASFIKAGAAPAFVIRGGKLHKISSRTLPAGVLYNMTAEKTVMKLQKDDIIVMMSDGVAESGDVAPWLMELFTYSLEGSASEMAEKILSTACDIHGRTDDMSTAVIKIL